MGQKQSNLLEVACADPENERAVKAAFASLDHDRSGMLNGEELRELRAEYVRFELREGDAGRAIDAIDALLADKQQLDIGTLQNFLRVEKKRRDAIFAARDWGRLQKDVLFCVFRLLDARSLACASGVCTTWRRFATKDELWRIALKREGKDLYQDYCNDQNRAAVVVTKELVGFVYENDMPKVRTNMGQCSGKIKIDHSNKKGRNFTVHFDVVFDDWNRKRYITETIECSWKGNSYSTARVTLHRSVLKYRCGLKTASRVIEDYAPADIPLGGDFCFEIFKYFHWNLCAYQWEKIMRDNAD